MKITRLHPCVIRFSCKSSHGYDSTEITEAIRILWGNASNRYDNIKDYADIFSIPLHKLFNLSLQSSMSSQAWKFADCRLGYI